MDEEKLTRAYLETLSFSDLKKLADEYGYGTWTNAKLEQGEGYLQPGDIVSQPGHVWICLGRCPDDSILLIHSSPTKSVTGKYG